MSKYGRRWEMIRQAERPVEEAEREAAGIVRTALEHLEAAEMRLVTVGFRGLASAVYDSRLRLAGELRSFEGSLHKGDPTPSK